MLIKKTKYFLLGIGLASTFFTVFAFMFTPFFGDNLNAFKASDQMFNSISKGSINYTPKLIEQAQEFNNTIISVIILRSDKHLIPQAQTLFQSNSIFSSIVDEGLLVEDSLGKILHAVLTDSLAMFNNNGLSLSNKYSMDAKEAMYVWWCSLKNIDMSLKNQKMFKQAAFIEDVVTKSVEVAYNYYGITPESALENVAKLTFALVFYVVYTMWWGYAIMFLFEGFGLAMTAGNKEEI